jgi:Leucine-rich repeat (LRR) protein
MKTIQIKPNQMKKLLLLMLLFTGMVNAQPIINNPTPYRVCDDNSDGISAFDFNIITPTLITQQGTEILYYLTLVDSQTNNNPISTAVPFTNTNPFNQTIYIRAWETSAPNVPAFTTLSLVVSQKPTVTMSQTYSCIGNNITITTTISPPGSYNYNYTMPLGVVNPGNVASFTTSIQGSYYVSVTDSVTGCTSEQAGIYPYFYPQPIISVNATSICNSNPATVTTGVNLSNLMNYSWTVPATATNPGNVGSFTTSISGIYSVVATDTVSGCVSNQNSTTVINQSSVAPTFSTILTSVCPGYILPTSSDNGINGSWSPSVFNSDTYVFTPFFGQCASNYSIFINVLNGNTNANQAQNLVQNTTINTAVFDLTSQNTIINNSSGIQFKYYPSLADANASTNMIINPSAYTNISNPQTIGVRVFELGSESCATVTSFKLIINNLNNVYIPDANFKARLISFGIDSNLDGEIQFTEALAPNYELNVSYNNISDLTGIEAFTNITGLICNNNTLNSLNVSTLTNLINLDCSVNQISNLNVGNLILLETLKCNNNQLTAINVIPLVNLKTLICSFNSINTLNLSNMLNLERLEYVYNFSTSLTFLNVPKMKYLDCYANYSLNSLNISGLPLLEYLNCSYNGLTFLNVNGLTNLNYLDCSGNPLTTQNISGLNNLITFYANQTQISTIDLTNLPNLTNVSIYNNQLTNLNLTGSNNVNNLNCSNNQLTNLNLTGVTGLQTLYCQYNQLASINFAGLTGLISVLCDHNLLTSIDFSNGTNLSALSCSYNNLNSINIKNGTSNIDTQTYYSWSQNPLLTYVCCDDGELASVTQILNQSTNANNGNVNFNSYCTFVPGGNYNTITGTVRFDANNNGCDTNDNLVSNFKIGNTNFSNTTATFTNNIGNYTFFTAFTDQIISPELENPSYFNVTPQSSTISFPSNNNLTQSQDFCLSANGIKKDLEIAIEPIEYALPGNEATYKIVYKNKGNTQVSGNLNFNYNDALLNFNTATVTPNSQSVGVLNWNFINLLPFESRSIIVTMNVNSSSVTPPVIAGSILNFSSNISPISNDENQLDNTFTYNQNVVNSVSPNAITCLQGASVSTSEIGNYLHYSIVFENTGNYLAETVVIKDLIDTTKYDINSIQLLDTSHPVYTKVSGNFIEFIFQNINLEATSGNPPVGGHGNVLFKIKTKSDLVSGDTVNKSASIFFDYSFPLTTTDAATTFINLSNSIFELDKSVSIYPNPTTSIININTEFNIKSIEVYDVQGRVLETILGNTKTFDISSKQNGIYFLKITTDKGSKIEKLVKE